MKILYGIFFSALFLNPLANAMQGEEEDEELIELYQDKNINVGKLINQLTHLSLGQLDMQSAEGQDAVQSLAQVLLPPNNSPYKTQVAVKIIDLSNTSVPAQEQYLRDLFNALFRSAQREDLADDSASRQLSELVDDFKTVFKTRRASEKALLAFMTVARSECSSMTLGSFLGSCIICTCLTFGAVWSKDRKLIIGAVASDCLLLIVVLGFGYYFFEKMSKL